MDSTTADVGEILSNFTNWLEAHGETSWDHQSFFAGPVGRAAKSIYYRNRYLGTAAVAPMIFFEAFLPSARRLFHERIRFPIADAHYSMGFAFLYEATSNPAYLDRAIHFLEQLRLSRSPGYKEYCWGYPFDWVTRHGTTKAWTPFITTTPYCYEAFLQVARLLGQMSEGRRRTTSDGGPTVENRIHESEVSNRRHRSSVIRPLDLRDDYTQIAASIARHAMNDIHDYETSSTASSCSYSPLGEGGVLNAAAYRAFLLTSASQVFENGDYARTAERNLNFVLENQNQDGSWYYAVDGVRDFVDHYHTCFVMKALAKVHALLQRAEVRVQRTEDRGQRAEVGGQMTENRGQEAEGRWQMTEVGGPVTAAKQRPGFQMAEVRGLRAEGRGQRSEVRGQMAEGVADRIYSALSRGVDYYLKNLFAEDGLPKPFAKAPRLTVYKRELYDCAECINLCLLLRDRFPQLGEKLEVVVQGILSDWVKPDGSFRSRRLHLGWDNVPMHRWGQAQMFRALAFYLRETSASEDGRRMTENREKSEKNAQNTGIA